MDSYDVRFWDTKKIADNASGGRYRVRWAVNGQEHCKSFRNKTLADGFLDNLKDAARDRVCVRLVAVLDRGWLRA